MKPITLMTPETTTRRRRPMRAHLSRFLCINRVGDSTRGLVLWVTALAMGLYVDATYGQSQGIQKSSISIEESSSQVPAPSPAPGKKSRASHNLINYTSSVSLGDNARDQEITWRFYVVLKTERSQGLKLVSEKLLRFGSPVTIAPITSE